MIIIQSDLLVWLIYVLNIHEIVQDTNMLWHVFSRYVSLK